MVMNFEETEKIWNEKENYFLKDIHHDLWIYFWFVNQKNYTPFDHVDTP